MSLIQVKTGKVTIRFASTLEAICEAISVNWWYIRICIKDDERAKSALALLYLTIGCRYTVTTSIDILLKYPYTINEGKC